MTAGALGDRIGAKRVFIAGFALFVLASLCCALAPNLGVLIAARGVQGIGAAVLVLLPASTAISIGARERRARHALDRENHQRGSEQRHGQK